jgi:hypothetical protein
VNRFRAATLHFLICLLVGGILWVLLRTVWYPAPLFKAVGGQEIFLILLGIDVALGPLMTFVVFKADRKKLRFDLIVIGLVQIAALAYGLNTLWAGRPVYVAALGHRFDVVQATDVEEKELAAAKQHLPWWGPKWVGVKEAEDKEERARVLFSAMAGVDYGSFPQHHAPLATMRDEILKRARPIAELKKLNPGDEENIAAWLANHRVAEDTVVFHGLRARGQEMTVVMDAKTTSVIGVAPFKPWN